MCYKITKLFKLKYCLTFPLAFNLILCILPLARLVPNEAGNSVKLPTVVFLHIPVFTVNLVQGCRARIFCDFRLTYHKAEVIHILTTHNVRGLVLCSIPSCIIFTFIASLATFFSFLLQFSILTFQCTCAILLWWHLMISKCLQSTIGLRLSEPHTGRALSCLSSR